MTPPMPARYADACGPRALAAIAGVSSREAARLLWLEGHKRGRRPRRPGETSSIFDLVRILAFTFGRPAQEWDPLVPGRLSLDSTAVARDLVRLERQPRNPWDLVEDPAEREAARVAVLAERRAALTERRPRAPVAQVSTTACHTVRSWSRRYDEGTWLLATWPPRGGMPDHVLALEDGELTAGEGDGRYNNRTLFTAYRVLSPRRRAWQEGTT